MNILVVRVFGEAGVRRVNKGFCVYLRYGTISKVLKKIEDFTTTSDICVPSMASTVIRPKHIVVVSFLVPSSKDFPTMLGRKRAFWYIMSSCGILYRGKVLTSSRIKTLGAIHVLPPCRRVMFISWK